MVVVGNGTRCPGCWVLLVGVEVVIRRHYARMTDANGCQIGVGMYRWGIVGAAAGVGWMQGFVDDYGVKTLNRRSRREFGGTGGMELRVL